MRDYIEELIVLCKKAFPGSDGADWKGKFAEKFAAEFPKMMVELHESSGDEVFREQMQAYITGSD